MAISAWPSRSALGFAPLGTMPVTRRAPYVALGIWAGGYDNPFRKRPDEFVGAGDMKHGLAEESYHRMRVDTVANMRARREALRTTDIITGVTFCVSNVYRERLESMAQELAFTSSIRPLCASQAR